MNVDELIKEFGEEVQAKMPPGLNGPLTKPERAILKTFLIWYSAKEAAPPPSSEVVEPAVAG